MEECYIYVFFFTPYQIFINKKYIMGKKLTLNVFIEKSKKIHGDKYDYSKVEYINANTKVCIVCPEHGEFWQRAADHIRGIGCPKCRAKNISKKYIKTTEWFIEKAKQKHGDRYDYSKVDYINSSTKVCIICPEHGEFYQDPSNHLQGHRCPKCATLDSRKKQALQKWQFIEKSKNVHGDKYDYSKVNYINNRTKVCIICPEHGEFLQTPHDHLSGYGCKKCGIESMLKHQRLTNDEFIKRSITIHGDKYNYSKLEYINYETPVCITCPTHGDFWQTPHSHLNGVDCPYCANEKYAKEEKLYKIILGEIKDEVIRWKKFKWLRYKSPMSIDIYLPNNKIGIEYQGIEHFKPTTFFGGEKRFEETYQRDKEKIKLCEKNGVKLFHFTFNKKDCKNWNEYKVYTNTNELINKINEYISEKQCQ